MATYQASGDDTYVGVFMVEQPSDWWLPSGYSLTPTGASPVLAWDPADQARMIYPVPGFRPPPDRIDSIAEVIQQELGPIPTQGIGPETRQALGMNRNDALGVVNRTIMAPVDLAVALLDLANYGINATIVAGTEGARRAGWMSETEAGQLRRDLMLLQLAIAAEAGRSPASMTAEARVAQMRLATTARAAESGAAPVVLRLSRETGVPFGRTFRVLEILRTDAPPPGAVRARTLENWLALMQVGKRWEREEAWKYDVTQLYIVKGTGKGKWILDAYQPNDARFARGPASQKFTQLAEIRIESAVAALREAYQKYRPGMIIADVRSTPLELRGKPLEGQLWLEVPVQTKPVPPAILEAAARWSVKIRDTQGKVY